MSVKRFKEYSKFQITMDTPEGQFKADVFVYDTEKQLNTATRAYNKRFGIEDTEKLSGVCHRFKGYNKNDELYPDLGIIRLSKEHLGIGVVSHEATHLAIHVYDTVWEEEIDPDEDEEFAYLLGDIVRQIVNGLYETNSYET